MRGRGGGRGPGARGEADGRRRGVGGGESAVRLCGCAAVRLCGCAAVRLCGCAAPVYAGLAGAVRAGFGAAKIRGDSDFGDSDFGDGGSGGARGEQDGWEVRQLLWDRDLLACRTGDIVIIIIYYCYY